MAAMTLRVLLSLLPAAALATDVPSGPDRAAPPDAVHVQNYGDRDAACLRWTDNCRMCSRDADGKPACSNIGISCQPAAVKCLSRKEDEKK
jgi:hypothetical protein